MKLYEEKVLEFEKSCIYIKTESIAFYQANRDSDEPLFAYKSFFCEQPSDDLVE